MVSGQSIVSRQKTYGMAPWPFLRYRLPGSGYLSAGLYRKWEEIMERAVTVSRMDGKQSGGGHERRIFYDKCGRYLFIASAFLMTIIIFSIIFLSGGRAS